MGPEVGKDVHRAGAGLRGGAAPASPPGGPVRAPLNGSARAARATERERSRPCAHPWVAGAQRADTPYRGGWGATLTGRLRARAVQPPAGRSGHRRGFERTRDGVCGLPGPSVPPLGPGSGDPRPGGEPGRGPRADTMERQPLVAPVPTIPRTVVVRRVGQAEWGGAWPWRLLKQAPGGARGGTRKPERSGLGRSGRRDPARAGCARRASGIAWGARGLHLGGTLGRPPHRRPPAWMKLPPTPQATLRDRPPVCPSAGRVFTQRDQVGDVRPRYGEKWPWVPEAPGRDRWPHSSSAVASPCVPGRGAHGSSWAGRTTISLSPRASWVTTGSK